VVRVRDPSLLDRACIERGSKTISRRYRMARSSIGRHRRGLVSVAASLAMHAMFAILLALPERARKG